MSTVQKQHEMVEFTPDQRREIEEGRKAGVRVEVYAKPEFLAIQMREIRKGLLEGLRVEYYADSIYDWFQMQEIREGLEEGLDVTKYADPSNSFEVMRQIRLGLSEGYDLSRGRTLPAGILKEMRKALVAGVSITRYIKLGYEEKQLRQIRIALKKGLSMDVYLALSHRGAALREIRLGLEDNLDVSLYAKEEMNWQQMREIRLGLLERLPVNVYTNAFYSWQQMREIRLGLEKNLPVEKYSSLMYTEKEMREMRLALSLGNAGEEAQTEHYQGFSLMISADGMEAFIVLNGVDQQVSQETLMLALKEKGIVTGLDYFAIGQIVAGKAERDIVLIARGKEPDEGTEGWYEFFFNTDVKNTPKILEDGSVDYQNIDWFNIVHRGQRVAVYHGAGMGKAGYKVTGEIVPSKKGKEQPLLTGKGFTLLPDQITYVAEIDGKIDLVGNHLQITNVLILDEVNTLTGNIDFNGSVYVRGNVGNGAAIRAERDILVEGFIESAVLEAGGDIIVKKGNNSTGGIGYLKAGGDVRGQFFEKAKIIAGGDIRANYCLNSELHAGDKIEIGGREGMLAGGTAHAVKSIEAHYIGNRAGIATELVLGKHKELMREEAELEEKEKNVNHELFLLKNAYYEFRKNGALKTNSNPIYIKLEDAIYTKELEMGKLQKRRNSLEAEKEKSERAEVKVAGTLFQGVRVEINGAVCSEKQLINVTLRKRGDRIVIS